MFSFLATQHDVQEYICYVPTASSVLIVYPNDPNTSDPSNTTAHALCLLNLRKYPHNSKRITIHALEWLLASLCELMTLEA